MDKYVQLRHLQQYSYCPHRLGLMQINCDWDSNFFVVSGDILHENVNNIEFIKMNNKYIAKSIHVFNEEFSIYGIIDVLEFVSNKTGLYIDNLDGRYNLQIIEYKNSSPKSCINVRKDDLLQIYGQKLCVDSMFNCDSKAFVYYGDIKKRVKVEFGKEIEDEFFYVLEKIKEMYKTNMIPPIRKDQKCNGCSMKNLCLPLKRKVKSFRELLENEEIT